MRKKGSPNASQLLETALLWACLAGKRTELGTEDRGLSAEQSSPELPGVRC